MSAAGAAAATGDLAETLGCIHKQERVSWGCCASASATAGIGMTWPVFQSRWLSTTRRVREGQRGLQLRPALSTTKRVGAGLVAAQVFDRQHIDARQTLAAGQFDAGRDHPGMFAVADQHPIARVKGSPHSGSTHPLVTFSVRARRWGGTPHQSASLRRVALTSAAMNGQISAVKGPSS